MKNSLAPICLFTYNRLEETKQTVEALKNNFLAKQSELFIFSDGPKYIDNTLEVDSVRAFVKTISGFKKITINESIKNMGLASSIINGVSKVIKTYDSVIVLEDDLITSANFLNFMNQALTYYKQHSNIFSVSGYTMDINGLDKINKDFYFGCRASSWGWGTWRRQWNSVDWGVSNYKNFITNKTLIRRFNRGGSDMTKMLKAQMTGKIDSWAIRFCFQQFIDEKASLFPKISKVQSIGFSKKATHTFGAKKFITTLDNGSKQDFCFEEFTKYDKNLLHAFRKKFSFRQRALDKISRLIYG